MASNNAHGTEGRFSILLLVLIVTAAWTLGLHLARLPDWTNQRGSTFVAGQPLLTTADGYYYLRLAEEHASGEYRDRDELRPGQIKRPEHVPPVSALASALHKTLSIPMRELAFYLPPALAVLSSLALALAGWAVAGPWGGLAAGLAGAASPFWFVRCSLGWFDTDPLNLFFPVLAALGLTGFAFGPWGYWSARSRQVQNEPEQPPGSWRVRAAQLLLCAAGIVGLALWWPSVGLLALPLFCLAYGLSFMAPASRTERLAKLGLLLLLAAGLGFLGLGLHRHLPQALAGFTSLGDSALAHLGLITKQSSGAFAEVGQSISELTPLEISRLPQDLAGGWLPLAASLAGLALAALRRDWAALMLILPFVLLGALAGFAQRFVIFLVPAYALGLSLLAGTLAARPGIARLRPAMRLALAGLLAMTLAAPGVWASLTRPVHPAFNTAQAALAMSVGSAGSSSGLFWNWWDQGYFLQYFAKVPTLIDGGSQDPERIFLASLPLASNDPALAARWMRFVAAHDVEGFRRLAQRLGGPRQAAELLRAVFADPEQTEKMLTAAGLDPGQWKPYLFPAMRKPVFIYLTVDIIYKGWWYYYGSLFSESQAKTPPETTLVPMAMATIDKGRGTMQIGQGILPLSMVVEVSRNGLEHSQGASAEGMVALRVAGSPYLTLLVRPMYDSVAGQLLYGDPKGFQEFKQLAYHPFVGGVWLVQ
ncbi:STT3 domain-containing protein [Desulfocurvibacter africanus]|uniref:STT3 domain-containing protein n=1 Tax=Desulfocurvibacter africanus TaxID=873 RepID=UPI0004036CA4|nr:STT3 domain-containing protein [Desulfocurvibacter africanus]